MKLFGSVVSFIILSVLFGTTCAAQNSSYRIEQTELRIEPDFAGKVISVAAIIVVQNPTHETESTFGLNDRYEDVHVTADASPAPFRRRDGELTVTVENRGGHFLITCVLDQQGALYHLPLEIGMETTGGLQTKTVSLNEHHMTFTFGLPEEPKRIVLDPRGWIPMNVISVR